MIALYRTVMTKGGYIALVFFVMLCLPSNLWGGQDVEVLFDRHEIVVGESVVMTIAVPDADSETPPHIPDLDGFEVKYLGFKKESFRTMSIVVSGSKIDRKEEGGRTLFQYQLTPKALGKTMIPSFEFVVAGQAYRIRPQLIEVVDIQETSDDIFVVVKTDRERAYIGERIVVTLEWYFRQDIQNYRLTVPWFEEQDHFVLQDVEVTPAMNQRLIVNGSTDVLATQASGVIHGKQYRLIKMQKILIPKVAGSFSLDNVLLRCDVITGYRRNQRSPFFMDDFFGAGREALTQPFVTRSNALEIHVFDIPQEGRPDNFQGAIGQLDFHVRVEPKTLKEGDPVTMTMTISGTGNFAGLREPLFPDMDGFRSYDPEIERNVREVEGQLHGNIVLRKMFIPTKSGTLEIPQLAFSYFDTQLERFQTIIQGPYSITVEKNTETQALIPPAVTAPLNGLTPKDVQVFGQDIMYIRPDWGPMDDVGFRKNDVLVLAVLYGGSLLLTLCVWLVRCRAERCNRDVSLILRRKALPQARRRLKSLHKVLDDSQTFHDQLVSIFRRFMADISHHPVESVTGDDMRGLSALGLSETTMNRAIEFVETIDAMRFTRKATSRKDHEQCLKDLYSIIRSIEKEVR